MNVRAEESCKSYGAEDKERRKRRGRRGDKKAASLFAQIKLDERAGKKFSSYLVAKSLCTKLSDSRYLMPEDTWLAK